MKKTLLLTATILVASATASLATDIKAGDGAEVGSIVTLFGRQIVCSDYSDADRLYVVSELTMRKVFDTEFRVNERSNDEALKMALKAQLEAQKYVMKNGAFSCKWAQDIRYHVDKKEVTGSEKDVFHAVGYGLSSLNLGDNERLWIFANYDSLSLFATSSEIRQ
jgi:hypothetical protein